MTNGTTSETNGITRGTNGDGLSECPHCGSVAEYVSEHAKGKRWAVACTMTSKVAADEGKPMCRCRTPFFRDKGQARDVWNRRTAVTDHDFAMAVHDGSLWGKCSECAERKGYHLDAETIRSQQERIAELAAESNRINGENIVLRMMARDMFNDIENRTDKHDGQMAQYRRQLESLGVGGLNG